jgi:hypothetical protein
VIPARYLYPVSLFDNFRQLYLRFLKASALATALRLSAGETVHFATHADYRINQLGELNINGQGWLNLLPNADNLNLADAAEAAVARTLNESLAIMLRALLEYARIKSEISPDDDALLKVVADPVATAAASDGFLLTPTRWDQASLAALLARFGGDVAGLAHFDLFSRVYDAFALLRMVGISAAALIQATTNEPNEKSVTDFQSALRARYDAADWRTVIQPINDELRGLQRDALVAYILHQMRSHPATEHIDTPDKLFEYFLMDVQMEPCMQTSRIRHALSSVQLFIERCLMNLEPRVSPQDINATQWEWMKRYRVWEANRKVFLFPENWLEPELRDDKSPFFKEIESELLQSDITEDIAASALITYLTKLEEVAKLEPCGIYHIAADEQMRIEEVDHIIARTAGARRKYYYRRRESGSWTPWEQIKLDIEDNPVLPVVWKDRLLLFWVRIMNEGPATADRPRGANNTDPAITSLTLNSLPKEPEVKTTAALCWSEYYDGKWQPAKTSDVQLPTKICEAMAAGANAFNRRTLRIVASETSEGALRLGLELYGYGSYFVLYNTHSLPVRAEDDTHDDPPRYESFREALTIDESWRLTYYGPRTTGNIIQIWDPIIPREVLKPWQDPTIISTHQAYPGFDEPFFYEDSRHVFYVSTTQEWVPAGTVGDYGRAVDPGLTLVERIPDLVFERDPRLDIGPKFWGDGGPDGPGVVDPIEIQRYVTEDAHIRHGLALNGIVMYGNQRIAVNGALPETRMAVNGALPETMGKI